MITIIINFDVVGFHFYEDAPSDVEFLKNKHRHIFNIKIGLKVSKTNREKEIFIVEKIFKDYICELYGEPAEFNGMSCEMIAEQILMKFKKDGCVWVEVLEDSKSGARVEL